MSPRSRARAADIAVAAVFAASAAALFVQGDERDGSLPFFLAWLAVHVLYGIASGSFWALPIVVACPPLFVATASGDGEGNPLWLEALAVEAFYGISFAFIGVVARRVWQARRAPELRERPDGEQPAE